MTTKPTIDQINETLELAALQLLEVKEKMDTIVKMSDSEIGILARLKAATSDVPFHARAARGTTEPVRRGRKTVEPVMVKVEDSALDELCAKITALITVRPHTYGEIAEALGMTDKEVYGKVGSALMRLRRLKTKPAVNLGSARRALWWIPTAPTK